VANVSRTTSTVLDLDKLIQSVSDLTKAVSICITAYLSMDESGVNIVLAAGAGEAGRTMKAEGRSMHQQQDRW